MTVGSVLPPGARRRVLAALGFGQVVSWGSLYYSFQVLVVPMERELGWSRLDLNGALSLGLLAAGLVAVPVGRALDAGDGRLVMGGGSFLAAAALLAWSAVDSLFHFHLLWVLLGATHAATLYEPAFAVIARAYGPDYRRGITALTLIGGFASTVFVPLTQLMANGLGWRGALVVLAGLNLVVALVYALILPRTTAVSRRAAPVPVAGGVRETLRAPVYWALLVAFTAFAGAISTVGFHLVPLLGERGVATGPMLLCIALIGPAQVAGRIVLASLGGRLPTALAGRIALTGITLAILLLLLAPPLLPTLLLFAALFGACNGVMTIVRGTAVPDLVTREAYGTLNGIIAFPATVAKAAAPVAAAALWTFAHGYDAVLVALILLVSLAAGLFWLATILARRRGAKAASPDPGP